MPKIDATDRLLISLLQSDARRSNKALAEAAGIAASTCLERVRALERAGVITGYHAEIDPAALNRSLQATVVVRLMPKTKDTVDRFVEHIWSLPETMGVILQSGADDVVVHLGVQDTQRLRDLVLDKIASFRGVVDERSSLVYDYRRKPVLEVLPSS